MPDEEIDPTYCQSCGAQITGEGKWGHDDNCILGKQLEDVAGPGDSIEAQNFDFKEAPGDVEFVQMEYVMSGGAIVFGTVVESLEDPATGEIIKAPGLMFKFRAPTGNPEEFYEPPVMLIMDFESLDRFISQCQAAIRSVKNKMKSEGM